MKKCEISMLLYEDGGSLLDCISMLRENCQDFEIRLFCICGKPTHDLHKECAKLQTNGAITSYSVIENCQRNFTHFANKLFLSHETDYILFLSSSIAPCPDLAADLARKLSVDSTMRGVNPVLVAGWENTSNIAFMGMVCDFRHFMHFLYEGINSNDPLVHVERTFQFGHPAALMIRADDFRKINGFNTALDYLAFYDFCMRISAGGNAFTVLPECRVQLSDRFDSWKFCGIWNSAIQSGRLLSSSISANYPVIASHDSLPYKLDSWLNEYASLPFVENPSTRDEAWLAFRHHPSPLNLLKYIASLPASFRAAALELAMLLPASLPRAMRYYEEEADKIMVNAELANMHQFVEEAGKWQRSKGRFQHGLLSPGMELLQKNGLYNCSLAKSTAVFNAWIEIGEKFSRLDIGRDWPQIAVLMPVYNPEPEFLHQAIESVRMQDYPNWRLCIADDASTDRRVLEMLHEYEQRDKLIKVAFRTENGNISIASNSALELVQSPYTAFLDHDDTLAPEALGIVAAKLAESKDLRYIYSDEDHIDAANLRSSPIFRPDFDADLFFVGHLSVYETALLRKLGGFRQGLEGSQDFDLALRATEELAPREICHIPHILYHWRIHEDSSSSSVGAKPYVLKATQTAWLSRASRAGLNAEIIKTEKNNFFHLAIHPERKIPCSVIFMTDAENPAPSEELLNCLNNLSNDSEYLLCPMGKFAHPAPTNESAQLNMRIMPYRGNGFVRAANFAAHKAKGDALLFLYAGLSPLAGCRPEQLIFNAMREEIAVAGGLIWKNGQLLN